MKSDGTLGASLPALDIAAGVQPHSTKLVFDGNRFVFSWLSATVLRAIRLGENGEPLDAAPLSIASNVNYYDVTADTAPAPDRRSFVFSYRLVFGEEKARLLRAQSGVLVQPELTLGTPESGDNSLPAAATDGTKIALSFWSSARHTMARGYLDPIGITFAPSTFQDVGSVRTGKLWFDGKSYLLLESKEARGSLGVRRFDPTLAPVDSAKAGSGYLLEQVFDPYALVQVAAASNGAGKSLVAYPRLDPARLGGTIKVRLIDNDGLKDPYAAGDGGAGGAGGDGSGGSDPSGGTGGINGGTGGIDGGTGSIGTAQQLVDESPLGPIGRGCANADVGRDRRVSRATRRSQQDPEALRDGLITDSSGMGDLMEVDLKTQTPRLVATCRREARSPRLNPPHESGLDAVAGHVGRVAGPDQALRGARYQGHVCIDDIELLAFGQPKMRDKNANLFGGGLVHDGDTGMLQNLAIEAPRDPSRQACASAPAGMRIGRPGSPARLRSTRRRISRRSIASNASASSTSPASVLVASASLAARLFTLGSSTL